MKELKFNKEVVTSKAFTNVALGRLEAEASRFSHCRFEALTIKECCFGLGRAASVYEDCLFKDITLSSSAPGCAVFVRCTFKNINFKKLFCTDIVFEECFFTGIYEKGSLIGEHCSPIYDKERYFTKSMNNSFTGLAFYDVSFHNLDFTQQVFSEADHEKIITDVNNFLAFAKAELNQLGEFSLYDEAHRVLGILEMKNEDTNNQAWFEPLNFPKALQESAIYLAKLLKKWNNYEKR
jgi:uncharacterized protein YjbI with pentapeptide repeats